MSKTITIDELIPLLKKGWVAMDRDGTWKWYAKKPKVWEGSKNWMDKAFSYEYFYQFNIAPYQGDWKESLRRIK